MDLVFLWNLDYEKEIVRLKNLLISSPILNLPDGSKLFTVCSDACRIGIGLVLIQEGKVIAYDNR